MKIAVVTCYSDPNTSRARELRATLKAIPGVQPIIIKNSRRGLLRYPEVIWKLRQAKRHKKPEAYVLTFRGQEILPIVLRIAGKRPVWFDECVVPVLYSNQIENIQTASGRFKRLLAQRSLSNYRRWLHKCAAVFCESDEQAEISARTAQINLSRYSTWPTPAPNETMPTKTTFNQVSRLVAESIL